MSSGRCAVPDSWTRISRIERIFLLAEVLFSHTDLTDLTDFYSFGVLAVSLSEYRCLQRKKIRGICEIRVRLLFLNHIAKIQHFIFPIHRCSLLLTDTHRFRLLWSFSIKTKWEYPLLATKKSICEIRVGPSKKYSRNRLAFSKESRIFAGRYKIIGDRNYD